MILVESFLLWVFLYLFNIYFTLFLAVYISILNPVLFTFTKFSWIYTKSVCCQCQMLGNCCYSADGLCSVQTPTQARKTGTSPTNTGNETGPNPRTFSSCPPLAAPLAAPLTSFSLRLSFSPSAYSNVIGQHFSAWYYRLPGRQWTEFSA